MDFPHPAQTVYWYFFCSLSFLLLSSTKSNIWLAGRRSREQPDVPPGACRGLCKLTVTVIYYFGEFICDVPSILAVIEDDLLYLTPAPSQHLCSTAAGISMELVHIPSWFVPSKLEGNPLGIRWTNPTSSNQSSLQQQSMATRPGGCLFQLG